MSVYAIAVFLHIVGALMLFAALGLEWASVLNLRRAAAVGQAREWAKLLASLRFVGGPAVLTILATGIYLMATRWGGQGWIGVGFAGLVLLAMLGGALSGRRAGEIVREVTAGEGPVSGSLGQRLRDPVLVLSLRLRTALALGIVFVMSLKPTTAGALATLGVAAALGMAAALPAWTRSSTPQRLA